MIFDWNNYQSFFHGGGLGFVWNGGIIEGEVIICVKDPFVVPKRETIFDIPDRGAIRDIPPRGTIYEVL